MDKSTIVHELALIHAQEKYHEFFKMIPPESRGTHSEHKDLQELANFYDDAVEFLKDYIVD